ncbi:MAG: bacterioferritin-associated ferredoxin [Aureliella sp.]
MCFHVSWRKVINFIRIERVRVPSQVAECQSAGTGCGWCRHAIRRLVEKVNADCPDADGLQEWLEQRYPNRGEYASGREQHIAQGKGKPPAK